MKGNERKLLVLGASAPMAAQSEAIIIIVIIRRRGEEHKEKSKLFVNFLVIFSFKILFKKQFFLCLSGPPHTKAPAAKTIAPGKSGKKIAPGKNGIIK